MDNDMTFNFDQIFDRRASDSAKWKYFAADVLPMWVADMDFRCAAGR
jgi:cystathionine beta-lyase